MNLKRASFLLAVLLSAAVPAFAEGERIPADQPRMPELTTVGERALRNEIERKEMIEELIRLNRIGRDLQRPAPVGLDDVL